MYDLYLFCNKNKVKESQPDCKYTAVSFSKSERATHGVIHHPCVKGGKVNNERKFGCNGCK